MKKLSTLFIVLALVLTSCSSDDSSSPDTTDGDLVGIWTGVSVDYFGTTITVVPGFDDLVADFVGEAYDIDYTLTFTEDPNEVVSDGSYSIELTTTFMGVDQVDNLENLEFLEDSTWSREGDQLTTVTNGESSTVTILELTDTMLSLGIVQTQTTIQQGFEVTSTVNAVTTYTR